MFLPYVHLHIQEYTKFMENFHIITLFSFLKCFTGRPQIYESMLLRTKEDREYYSAGFVKLQVEFISSKPGVVKELTRLVKYWNSQIVGSALKGKGGLPSSYSMELITVLAWDRAHQPKKFDRLQGFKAVLYIIANELSTGLRFYWTVNYSKSMAERALKTMDTSNQRRFVFSRVIKC